MRRAPLSVLLLLAGCGTASALALPVEENAYLPREATTTYRERSLNRQAPLTIEHPHLPPGTEGSARIAGFCHAARPLQRRGDDGQWVLRQREVCENVAPRTLWPGHTEPRPRWSDQPGLLRQLAGAPAGTADEYDEEVVVTRRPVRRVHRHRLRSRY